MKLGSKLVKEFLFSNFDGLLGGSKGKFIPTAVMDASPDIAAACLRGMFDGDGSVTGKSLALCSFSNEMLRRAQLLLRRFGIHSVRRKHGLVISDVRDQEEFLRKVGLDCTAKRDKLLAVIQNKTRQHSRVTTIVPYLRDYLNHVSYEKKSRYSILRSLSVQQGHDVQVYARKLTKPVLRSLNAIEPYLGDRAQAISEYEWVQVKSIAKLGREHVYDLTVPETSCLVTNGLVTHNSDYAWTFVATKETRENEILNIEQIKGRNAELFPFSLRAQMNIMRIGDLDHDESSSSEGNEEGSRPKRGSSQSNKERPKSTGTKSNNRTYDEDLSEEE
jgi:hypothetical protein